MAMKRYKVLVPEFIAILEQNGFEKIDPSEYQAQKSIFMRTPKGHVIIIPKPDDIGYILESLLIDIMITHGLPSKFKPKLVLID